MSEYQVLARKYRPQTFKEVLGQDAIVTTLKNAIKNGRLAHAYLFCGSRGTGKTTLARLFAKALNCANPSPDHEPCNCCSFCKEIAGGASLDVLEVDGASNRGIDDIRQINETVGYTTASGKYKIYIIDEVHMLTKEAFNALLKTLEEPPPRVKFFFATTEPHKVLPTILSRCQRFNLNRIPNDMIIQKLRHISNDLNYTIEEEAFHIIANRAEGGLRDAESLLDQILAFHEGETISTESVASILGVMPREALFELDRAGKAGNLAVAFDIAHRLFSEGKDLLHFIEMLTEHFRNILLVKLCGQNTPALGLSNIEREKYGETAKLYRQDQCLALLDHMIETQNRVRYATSGRIALETVLLYIMRSHNRIPIDILIKRLGELEGSTSEKSTPNATATPPSSTRQEPAAAPPSSTRQEPAAAPKQAPPKKQILPPKPKTPAPATTVVKSAKPPLPPKEKHQHDTLLQFAAVELEGTIQKK